MDPVPKQVAPTYLCDIKKPSSMSIISNYPNLEDRVSEASFARCLSIILMFALAPALCPGCSGPEPAFAEAGDPGQPATKIHLTSAGVGVSGFRSLDIFFFNDDALQRLDTYQRIEGNGSAAAVGASRNGRKILAVLADSPYDRYRWAGVNSLSGLGAMLVELQKETPGHPFMSGIVRCETGASRNVSVALTPRTAEIELHSIRCDFQGRSYEGAPLEEVKVYLTNVSASCPVVDGFERSPFSFVNLGSLSASDLGEFLDPSMVSATIPRPVGSRTVYPGIYLYCYANRGKEADPGQPFTRLVVEGKVAGQTCYYPIEINRGAGAFYPPGIEAGKAYRFDLTFTRKGASHPDGALEPGTVKARLSVADWHTQKDSVITF